MEDTQSRIAFETLPEGECAVALGIWTAAHLAVPEHWAALQSALAQAATRGPAIGWDLRRLQRLDHSGAQVLWNAWGRHWPQAFHRTWAPLWSRRCRRRKSQPMAGPREIGRASCRERV